MRCGNHGSVNINVIDVSGARSDGRVLNAKLALFDSAHRLLAEGSTDGRFGIVRFFHPELGSCEEEESAAPFSEEGRARWDECFSAQSRWQSKWAPRVKYLDLHFANCGLTNVRISLSESKSDWWLWWVPMRHIGGVPYANFSTTVSVDAKTCRIASR